MVDSEIDPFFAQAIHRYQSIVLEYCSLATRSTLSEVEADALGYILAKAKTDELLNFLLTEFDVLIDKQLDRFDEKDSVHYQDQQARLMQQLSKNLALFRELQNSTHC